MATGTSEINGHHVELDFDKSLIVLNRATLRVDGHKVDDANIFYGTRDLATTLDDGTEVKLRLHSGMVGELARAQLQQSDGDWKDLVITE